MGRGRGGSEYRNSAEKNNKHCHQGKSRLENINIAYRKVEITAIRWDFCHRVPHKKKRATPQLCPSGEKPQLFVQFTSAPLRT